MHYSVCSKLLAARIFADIANICDRLRLAQLIVNKLRATDSNISADKKKKTAFTFLFLGLDFRVLFHRFQTIFHRTQTELFNQQT